MMTLMGRAFIHLLQALTLLEPMVLDDLWGHFQSNGHVQGSLASSSSEASTTVKEPPVPEFKSLTTKNNDK